MFVCLCDHFQCLTYCQSVYIHYNVFACSLFSALQKNSHASRSKLQEREEVCEPFVVRFYVYSDFEFECRQAGHWQI